MRKGLLAVACWLAVSGTARAVVDIPVLRSTVPINESGTETKTAYGIYVKVGDGGEARLFQLDTGNGSFLAGYSASAGANQYWGSSTAVAAGPFTSEFGSGIVMEYSKVAAKVTLSDASGSDLATIGSMVLGQVYTASGADIPDNSYWQDRIDAGEAPLHQTYYGNFGAGLYSSSHGMGPVDEQLFSALGQIDGLIGFALSLSGATPTLRLVFDTPGDRAYVDSFEYAALLGGGEGGVFPVTGWDTQSEYPLTAQSFDIDGTTAAGTNGVLDTGGLGLGLSDTAAATFDGEGLLVDGKVPAGHDFELLIEGAGELDGKTFDDFGLGFTTGTVEGLDLVEGSTRSDDLNFGPAIYNYYDVYFDLENGAIRFSAVPEPAAFLLLGLAGGVGAVLRARRRG